MNRFYLECAIQDKLRVLHKKIFSQIHVNPELTSPQCLYLTWVGPLLAYFAQLYIVSDNGEIKEEDLDLLEKQILGGLWKYGSSRRTKVYLLDFRS